MKNFKIEFKWAITFIIAQLAWMYLEKATGLHDEHVAKHLIYTNLFAVIPSVYTFWRYETRKYIFSMAL